MGGERLDVTLCPSSQDCARGELGLSSGFWEGGGEEVGREGGREGGGKGGREGRREGGRGEGREGGREGGRSTFPFADVSKSGEPQAPI
jgi:hypothetical protein